MGLSSIAALPPVQALLLAPIPPSGNVHTNLLSADESESLLAEARVARFKDATSARRGTFAPDLVPDEIARSQRFAADTVESQGQRATF